MPYVYDVNYSSKILTNFQ